MKTYRNKKTVVLGLCLVCVCLIATVSAVTYTTLQKNTSATIQQMGNIALYLTDNVTNTALNLWTNDLTYTQFLATGSPQQISKTFYIKNIGNTPEVVRVNLLNGGGWSFSVTLFWWECTTNNAFNFAVYQGINLADATMTGTKSLSNTQTLTLAKGEIKALLVVLTNQNQDDATKVFNPILQFIASDT